MDQWGKCLAVAAVVAGLLGGTTVWGEEATGAKSAAPKSTAATSAATKAAGSPVNINTADAAALEVIGGIGKKKAQAIVDYRQKNGPFKTVDDLKKVAGIKDKTLAKIKDKVTVGGQ